MCKQIKKKDGNLAWGQEGNAYRKEGWSAWGSTWFGGIGCEDRMRENACAKSHQVAIAVEEPSQGHRGFISYPDWPTFLEEYAKVPMNERRANESIAVQKMVKGYLDIDSKNPPPSLDTFDKVVERVGNATVAVFKSRYGVDITSTDLRWLKSENPAKLSMHVVVCTKGPQYVFQNNDKVSGAGHLASSIVEEDPELGDIIDMGVYTRNRCFRMFASSKYTNPDSVLEPYDMDATEWVEDYIVTYILPDHKVLNTGVNFQQGGATKGKRVVRSSSNDVPEDKIVERMLDLLKVKVHATAFHDRGHGLEDAYDMLRGVKFNYTDRTEACFTGHVHEGSNNLACWVDEGDNIWCRCFSDKCQGQIKKLGEVSSETRDEYLKDSVMMNSPFVTERDGPPVAPLDGVIRDWLSGAFKGLCVRSITGSGKTTLIKHLMELPEFRKKTVLYLTYRQTLAFNVAGGRLGNMFDLYLDIKSDLADRKRYPHPVTQLDSIHGLTRDPAAIPKFDLIIMDESEKLFEHLSARTLDQPVFTQQKLQHIVRRASYILALDALFGAESYEMLQAYGVSMKVVINSYRSPNPRHYRFTYSWSKVIDDILEKLASNKTVYVASMSTEALYRLQEAVETRFPDKDFGVMLHTSKTDDSVKRELADADELWKDERLVCCSPSVEAGVDCSKKRFDYQYIFANLMSTTASGLFQMAWRARDVGCSEVLCYAQQGIRLGPGGKRKISVSECLDNLRYLKDKAVANCDREVVIKGDEEFLLPKLGPYAVVTAHNNARKYNSESRFYMEFADIVQEQGHRITYDLGVDDSFACRKARVQWRPNNINAEHLVSTPRVLESEFMSIEDRIYTCRATEDDKWKAYKHKYMRSWGIDSIDHEFVKANGTDVTSPAVKLLVKLIYEDIALFDIENPCEQKLYVLNLALKDILKVMGWASVFDVGNPVCIDDKQEELLQITFFKEYNRYIKVFNPRAEIPKQWDHKSILAALNTLFHAMGLNILSKRKRKQVKKVDFSIYTYSIDNEKCEVMAALVNLRVRPTAGLMPRQDVVKTYLRGIGYGPYEKYVVETDCLY